jgi:hypothetical protein
MRGPETTEEKASPLGAVSLPLEGGLQMSEVKRTKDEEERRALSSYRNTAAKTRHAGASLAIFHDLFKKIP